MSTIQQLMIAIISVVLGATSSQVFKTMSEQEMKILFWTSMALLVMIFLSSALKTRKKKKVVPLRRTKQKHKRKPGKRRSHGP
jgi:DMSO/TMAO reductase YedYZ heme-binding membrane subunit